MVMRQYHPSACSSTYLNIMYVMAYINGAAQACPIYINHNGIMLNRSLGFLWRGLSLKRTAAMPRAPPGSSSPVRWVSAVPFVLARPHPPALSVFRRAWCLGGVVRLFRPPCPTLFRVFVRSQSPPGSFRRSVRSCPPVPALSWRCFGVPGVLAVPLQFFHPCPPALFVFSFGRVSAASRGRRGFRSPCEASSHAARNRNKGWFACAVGIPIRCASPSDRSIDATSLVSRRAHAPAPPGG